MPDQNSCAADPRASTIIDSEIPPSHPHKRAIEDVVFETTAALPGVWKATIRQEAAWWAVSLETSNVVLRTLFHDSQLHPELVRERLWRILQRHR
jgi:hypothetical protein